MRRTQLLLVVLGLMLIACDPKTKKATIPETIDSIEVVDSIENTEIEEEVDMGFSVNTLKLGEFKSYTREQFREDWSDELEYYGDYFEEVDPSSSINIEIDMPVTNNATLKTNIEDFIKHVLYNDERGAIDDLGDGTPLIQMLRENFYNTSIRYHSRTNRVILAEETDDHITYIKINDMGYFFGDGHFHQEESATFDKKTGNPFTWDMFTNMDGIFALINEYADGYEYDFPEPYINPWIQDGKVFIIYERGDFEDEVCNFTFDQVKNFLTDEGKAFFATTTPQRTPKTSFSVNTIELSDQKEFTYEEVLDWYPRLEGVDEWCCITFFDSYIDLPVTNNEALKDSIEAYIKEETHTNELDDTDLMAKGMRGDLFDKRGPSYEYQYDLKMTENLKTHVTYRYTKKISGNCYMDVSSENYTGITFKKDTGKMFTWDMILNKEAILHEISKKRGGEECGMIVQSINPWVENDYLHIVYKGRDNEERVGSVDFDSVEDFLSFEGLHYFDIY